ncbi:MAG: DNA repair protein RadC [Bacteroidia bacterium]|jgi:DNA repair protein RadC|nr:DNA repair protein RadC [Bacteroidia bacterium]
MTEIMIDFTPISQWAEDDRPREKMMLKGIHSLSDAELLAILISTGTKRESALDLSRKVLSITKNNINQLGKLDVLDFTKIKGIGKAKAITIAAALELGRRRKNIQQENNSEVINSSRSAFDLFEPIFSDLVREEFWVLYLNRNNKVIELKRASEGGVSGTVADPRIIFKHAVLLLASSIILAHNHPSGNLKPSEHDKKLTKKFMEAGWALDVHVVDHLIISEHQYFSFADQGLLL